jgi:predicted amidohydrolase
MKIALVQLDAKDLLWEPSEMPKILRQTMDADLVVFPECMPFDEAISITEAENSLASMTEGLTQAVIAGGYVLQNEIERNAVFLSYGGKIHGRYFKRLRWNEPQIAPGGEATVFEWNNMRCIPLICADAADNPSQTGTRMMYEAIRLGAGEQVPIVVSSYGAWLNEPYWQEPLQTWASGCGAPLLICGVSGKGDPFTDAGVSGNFGGGGSGVFWPYIWPNKKRSPWQRKRRGILLIDIKTGDCAFRQIRKNTASD